MQLSEIIRAVSQIRKWLPEVGLANVRFHPGPHRSLEVEQAGGRTDKNGQFVLAIDGSQQSPEELFEQAQLAEENGDGAEFALHNPPATKKPWRGLVPENTRQTLLIAGMDCLAGATQIEMEHLGSELAVPGGPLNTVDKTQTIHRILNPAAWNERAVSGSSSANSRESRT